MSSFFNILKSQCFCFVLLIAGFAFADNNSMTAKDISRMEAIAGSEEASDIFAGRAKEPGVMQSMTDQVIAKMKENGFHKLHALAMGDSKRLSLFLKEHEGLNVDVLSNDGKTPLHIAVTTERHKNIQILLSAGADPNIPNVKGMTPLHFAARIDNSRIFNMLTKAGADATIKDGGNTPLDYREMNEENRLRRISSRGVLGRIKRAGYNRCAKGF